MEMLLGDTAIGHTLMTLISFLILLYIVHRFAFKPISNVINERQNTIAEDLSSAQEAKESSTTANAKAQKMLSDARLQGDLIINDARKQSITLQHTMETEMQEKIQTMRKEAEESLEQQRIQTIEEMENSIVNIAFELAEKVIQREISEADHRKLVDEFIQGLEAEVNNG